MKTYVKDCEVCGVVFEAKHHAIVTCSEDCRAQNKKRKQAARGKRHYEANREDYLERSRIQRETYPEKMAEYKRKWVEENREHKLQYDRDHNAPSVQAATAEAKRLKPILDNLSFTPENIPHIECMVDYIETFHRLPWLLDWYWLSDAKEYLDEQQ